VDETREQASDARANTEPLGVDDEGSLTSTFASPRRPPWQRWKRSLMSGRGVGEVGRGDDVLGRCGVYRGGRTRTLELATVLATNAFMAAFRAVTSNAPYRAIHIRHTALTKPRRR
jgi:hypothetical protein